MSGSLGFWEGKKLSCQFMTATSFLQGELVRDEEFYTGPRTREKEKNEMHWGAGERWTGLAEGTARVEVQVQVRAQVQVHWRNGWGGKSGTHESVRVYFILERDQSEKPSAVGARQSAEAAQYRSSGGTIR